MEIKLKVISIKDEQAILSFVNNDEKIEIVWPISSLPVGVSEGDYLNFLISSSEPDEALRNQKAKDILNEILNIE